MSEELKSLTQKVLVSLRERLSVDLKGFAPQQEDAVEATVRDIAKNSSPEQQTRVLAEFQGNGPIEPLLSDPEVTEILINGGGTIWVERQGRLSLHSDLFLSEITFTNFCSRLYQMAGVEPTVDQPYADGVWLGNRIHVVVPPISRHPTLSIRKKAKNSWTLTTLVQSDWATQGDSELLLNLVRLRKNILFVGGTSSGKTTALQACLREIHSKDRLVVVEDTPELEVPNSVSVNLTARHDSRNIVKEIALQDLVRQSLRMRPDRVIMGEVRGPEAKDLLMALSTGHEGSMGTLHANSAQEALLRLEMLIQLGAPQWSLSAIRRLIYLALHYIVVVKRDHEGKRRLDGIYRITSLEDFGFLTEKCTEFVRPHDG